MVVTWDGKHTMPCCQGFTLEIDGGAVTGNGGRTQTIQEAWASPNFERLRSAHRLNTWDRGGTEGEPICRSCAVTKKPTPVAVQV
jgi:hypothetical protein